MAESNLIDRTSVHESRGGISRRALFTALGTALAAAAPAAAAPPDTPIDADPNSLLNKLVRRVTMGITQEEVNLAQQLGYDGYIEYHLNHQAIDDSAMPARIAGLTTLNMTYAQLYALNVESQVSNELIEAAILRAVYSKRQLYERMVEFWTDHFNIDINVNPLYKNIDDRDVIRPHALGTFSNLLAASARSPAMLFFLNNNVSTRISPNENYARELMELHTMGAYGGYTQTDVIEVARCLTGWTIWGNTAVTPGAFRYNSSNHDTASKVVLGRVIPARAAALGEQDGIEVLNTLVTHPSTANYLATKLCRWFLGDGAPKFAIRAVVDAYTATGGDIKSMVRACLRPQYVAAAPPKLKRPFHYVVSALRVVPSTIASTVSIRSRLSSMGQLPYNWGTPDGYPDSTDYWAGNVIGRWNFGAELCNSNLPNVTPLITSGGGLFDGLTTAEQMATRLNDVVFVKEMTPTDRNRIRDYLLPDAPTNQRKTDSVGLAVGSPGFQWY